MFNCTCTCSSSGHSVTLLTCAYLTNYNSRLNIIGIADDTSSPWTRCIFRQIAQQNPAYGMAMTVCYGVTLCVYKRVNILPYFPFWMSYCSQTWSNCRRPQLTIANVIHVSQGLLLGLAEGREVSKTVNIDAICQYLHRQFTNFLQF